MSTVSLGPISHWSRRARNSSGGSGCPLAPALVGPGLTGICLSGPNSSAIMYPDPLVYYMPTLLDDPDLLVATGKRVLKLPNYLVGSFFRCPLATVLYEFCLGPFFPEHKIPVLILV
ncbi:unnamed protein product [Echinostoma caproni]|uniref:Uncharacterized protein n=1 Tax=Echinostoma caproni TaxID=27848 RepID=A0A3P8GQL8_9TREM|nr:unnamed protein product [Echinostoma caproni]